ncbi:uncharacterized protein LOC106162300 isoform X1 [Lingula anatina]|uniref:glutathione gamma-glutamylcysteinyltransferase n=1 Tax=Lingula anatina TaxID=7574 RepID=A0A1S3I9Q8_LINAN|nr:uncharacterized protein LOC106162300 isoform X1 [Lingula anatina]|eukprot:XP_013395000.1 uncharacterized protein LOC106162300 isoform X1 [Lingula anatina]
MFRWDVFRILKKTLRVRVLETDVNKKFARTMSSAPAAKVAKMEYDIQEKETPTELITEDEVHKDNKEHKNPVMSQEADKPCVHQHTQIMQPPTQFYRRELPDTCISFSSEEGKLVFRKALDAGHLNSYFSLASQFRTQEEPAYCGLSTLVMVLNALAVDPGRVWKGPWRWYHEDMLECCVPLQIIQEKGITLREFVCLAICNYLDVVTTYVDHSASLKDFREIVKELTQVDDKVLVCSYSRKTLKQTGAGHFSPIGAYEPERDLVLLMDVARFKYPPHWVSLPLLWEAMKTVDSETGSSRGYCIIKRNQTTEPMVLFRTSPHLSVTLKSEFPEGIRTFLKEWETWLNVTLSKAEEESQKSSFMDNAVFAFIRSLSVLGEDDALLSTQIDMSCAKALTQTHMCCVENLVEALSNTNLHKRVESITRATNASQEIRKIWMPAVMYNTNGKSSGCIHRDTFSDKLHDSAFLTALMFAWPYKEQNPVDGAVTRGDLLKKILHQELDSALHVLKNEIEQLSKLLKVVLKKYYHCQDCGCKTNVFK